MTRALRGWLLVLCCAVPARALAVYECGGQTDSCTCGRNNPYPCCDNGGNCTWWAWNAACCNWGIGLPGWGNANQWAGNASANGNYAVLGSPVKDAVACRTLGAYGHVAFTTSVSGSTVHVTEENCWGNYGMRSATYTGSFFQAYILPNALLHECNAGDSQVQGCGRCGTQSRGCGGDGRWGGWSACSGEKACLPGQVDTRVCGDCGEQHRTCTGQCEWPEGYGACAGNDPPGPPPCETSYVGACHGGHTRCVAGNLSCVPDHPPAAEVCNGADEDCDGVVDDGAPLAPGVAPPAYAAEWVDGAWPRQLGAGVRGAAWLSFRNVGREAWKAHTLSLRPDAVLAGAVSRLQPAGGWPNVDAAALLDSDVAPGAVAVFRFELQGPVDGGDVVERFTVAGPEGVALACPSPAAELSVASAEKGAAAREGASARPLGCASGPGWILLLPLGLARRRRR